jgi:hypothetical protein
MCQWLEESEGGELVDDAVARRRRVAQASNLAGRSHDLGSRAHVCARRLGVGWTASDSMSQY